MAEEDQSQQDKTEEPTPERREEFREKGQVASSKEVTSVFVLVSATVFLSLYLPKLLDSIILITKKYFGMIADFQITKNSLFSLSLATWNELLIIILPIFVITSVVAIGFTFMQTRFNVSSKLLKPDFTRLNILKGLARMVNTQALMELVKGIGKLGAICIVSYLILYSEIKTTPGLMNLPLASSWKYWGDITKLLFYNVAGLLLVVAAADYIYNYMSLEKRMKMSKQDIKEEMKRREVDPQVKGRMRRIQRDILSKQTVAATKTATVLITNPTHYSIAIKYDLGMPAPLVVAKGIDHLALEMREVAKENDIPLVENKLLARTLYRLVDEGQEIPESLYKAVSEVIKYVFSLKGIKINRQEN